MATRKKLGEVLLEAGLIDELQLDAALSHQRSWGGHLGRILIDSGFLTEQRLVETLSQLLGVPRVELGAREAQAGLLEEVPLDFAEKFNVVPVALRAEAKGEVLYVAMSDPTNLDAIDTLQFKTGKRVSPMIASETEVEGAIRRFYYGERPRELTTQSLQNVQFPGRDVETRPPPSLDDDIPVITGATLLEPADAGGGMPDAGNDPDWFLQMDAAPRPAAPASMPPPVQSPSSSGAFSVAPPAPASSSPGFAPPASSSPGFTPPASSSPGFAPPASSSPGFAPPSSSSPGFAPPASSSPGFTPPASPPAAEPAELFGAPNSFLGRDDETGLGQSDAQPPGAGAAANREPTKPVDVGDHGAPGAPPVASNESEPVAIAAPATRLPETQNPFAGQHSPFGPPPEQPAPSPPPAAQGSWALPVAASRPDDDVGADVQSLEPDIVVDPMSIGDDDDTPIELATAADFLHGGAPPSALPDRGLSLDDDDDVPIELASAAELISAPSDASRQEAAGVELPSSADEEPLLLATAAELAQMDLGSLSEAREPTDAVPEPPALEDLDELKELALARLDAIGDGGALEAPSPTSPAAVEESLPPEEDDGGLDIDVDVDVHAAPSAVPEAQLPRGGEAASMAASASPVEDAHAQSLRPLPPPGGVQPDEPDDAEDGPIKVVNMPPDRRPVGFVTVPPAPKAEAPAEDDFGNPLDPTYATDGEMEVLDIEGSVFDADSEETAPPPAHPPVEVMVPASEDAEAAAARTTAEPASEPVSEPEGEPVREGAKEETHEPKTTPPAVPLSAGAIQEMERQHDGTTTLSGASVVDTPERVGGSGASHAEVMSLALPTPAYSDASVVDAPWRLAGEPAPPGRGAADVPLAPFGVATSALAQVDDVAKLAPPPLDADAGASDPVAVALPGRSPPPLDDAETGTASPPSVPMPDTMSGSQRGTDSDDNGAEGAVPGLADAWREAAEQQLHYRRAPDVFEVPEHRRPFAAPAPAPAVEEPRPQHAYQSSGPASASAAGPAPWAILVDAAAHAPAREEPQVASDVANGDAVVARSSVEEASAAEDLEEARAEDVEEALAGDVIEEARAEDVEEAGADEAVQQARADDVVKEALAEDVAGEAPSDDVDEAALAGHVVEEPKAEALVDEVPANDALEEASAEAGVAVAPEPAAERATAESAVAGGWLPPRRGDDERSHSGAGLPSRTPRSVLVAEAVHMDDDLTPESSPPTSTAEALAKAAVENTAEFPPTPTMITRMSPEELRVLAERLLQRGAVTADDIDAARKGKAALAPAGVPDDDGDA